MEAVARAVDEGRHARVPEAGAVAQVDARREQRFEGERVADGRDSGGKGGGRGEVGEMAVRGGKRGAVGGRERVAGEGESVAGNGGGLTAERGEGANEGGEGGHCRG